MPKSLLTLLFFCYFTNFSVLANDSLALEQVLISIDSIMEKNKIPGLLLTMVTKDSVLYDGGRGIAHIEKDRKVDAQQLFRMGSITKTLAAVAMLQLEKAGHFKLMDNLKDAAPEIPFKNRWSSTNPVKIIHLLEHTAGFDDMHIKAVYNKGTKELPTKEMMQLHKESLISRWKPGERHAYSNSGYVVLGYLIEKFSGQSYHDYIQQNIFDPVGMTSSNLLSFPTNPELHAQGYAYKNKAFKEVPFYAIHGGIAGVLNSNGADMAKYIQFFLNDGRVDSNQVIPKGWIERMETPKTSLAAKNGRKIGGYALANAADEFDERFPFFGHDGGIDGFSSSFKYNRSLGVGFALSNNGRRGMNKIAKEIIKFLTKDFTPLEKSYQEIELEKIKPFFGVYDRVNPRNQLMHPLNKIFEGDELELIEDTLCISGLLTGTTAKYLYVGDNQFQRVNLNSPSLILVEGESGPNFIRRTRFFEKTSYGKHWAWIIWYGGSLIFGLTFALFGIVWLIINRIRKESVFVSSPIIWLTLSSLALISFFGLFTIMATGETYHLADKNWKSMALFSLPLFLPICAIIGNWIYFKNIRKIDHKFLKYYLLLASLSLLTLAIYFSWHGYVGLRLWAY